jgi:hypothetical protein
MFSTDREWKYGGDPSPYPSKIASWYNKGAIVDVEIGDGFPSGNTTQPAFLASSLSWDHGRPERPPGCGDQGRESPVQDDGDLGPVDHAVPDGPPGRERIARHIGVHAPDTGSVARGELLMRYQDLGAQKMTDVNQHCIGVVQYAATSGNIVMAVTEGTDSEIMVKNSSPDDDPPCRGWRAREAALRRRRAVGDEHDRRPRDRQGLQRLHRRRRDRSLRDIRQVNRRLDRRTTSPSTPRPPGTPGRRER